MIEHFLRALVSFAIFGFTVGFLWLFPLIDCIVHEKPAGKTKVNWILTICLLNALGGLLYLILRRPERIRMTGE